jgi:hypothetical protein
MLKAMQQCELVDKNSSQGKALGGKQAFCWDLPVFIKNALEMLIKIFNRHGSKLVKDAAHLDAIISMRGASVFGSHQDSSILRAERLQFGAGVMPVAKHEANFRVKFAHQRRSRFAVSNIGRSQFCRQGNPDLGHGRDQMEFPAIHLAMPARFGPRRFGLDGGVGNDVLLAVFLVPLTASGPQNGAIDCGRSPVGLPGIDQLDQHPAQAANLGRQALRQPFEAPFPGPTGREAFSFARAANEGFPSRPWAGGEP